MDPDRFSVRLTLLTSPERLESLVENVEARCRAAIDAKLPVVSEETDLERVTEVRLAFPENFSRNHS